MIPILLVATSHAGDDISCAIYAKTAVEQNERRLHHGCALSGPLWSSERAYHFDWCMKGTNHRRADEDRRRREDALRACTGAPPVDEGCDNYATAARSQALEAELRGCGFPAQPQWSTSYDVHYQWCVHGDNHRLRASQMQERKRLLTERCATATGDLQAHDWCYELDLSPAEPRVVFRPVLHNDTARDFRSPRGGSVTMLTIVDTTTTEKTMAFSEHPLLDVPAGTEDVLDAGLSLPFGVDRRYLHPGSFRFTHPDDTDPRNNRLVNRSGDAIRGEDLLLPGGRLAHHSCHAMAREGCDHPSALDVTLRIRTIAVLDEGDGVGNAEPYTLPWFFSVEQAKAPPWGGDWQYAPRGGHGSLGTAFGAGWGAGDVIDVPIDHRWTTRLQIGDGSSTWGTYVAALLVLMEEDHLPAGDLAEQIRKAFAPSVQQFVLSPAGWPLVYGRPLTRYPDTRERLESLVVELVEKESHHPVDLDDLVGVGIFAWSWEQLAKDPVQRESRVFDVGSGDGRYRVDVDVIARPVCSGP